MRQSRASRCHQAAGKTTATGEPSWPGCCREGAALRAQERPGCRHQPELPGRLGCQGEGERLARHARYERPESAGWNSPPPAPATCPHCLSSPLLPALLDAPRNPPCCLRPGTENKSRTTTQRRSSQDPGPLASPRRSSCPGLRSRTNPMSGFPCTAAWRPCSPHSTTRTS